MNEHIPSTEEVYEQWLAAPDSRKVYRVWIDGHAGHLYVDVPYHVGIGLREGFWVDKDWQYTVGCAESVMWVPPAIFRLVTKVLLDE